MIRERNTGSEVSILDQSLTGGLGRLIFHHPAGTFSPSPASNILIEAIAKKQDKLHGVGIDWGSGIGCLAILAAKIAAVDCVYGLEISKENLGAAVKNTNENNVIDKVHFMLSDSYVPYDAEERQKFESLRGNIDFIVSNPPSSDWDDGFGFRRIVMSGATEYLRPCGIVLLNISFQYGAQRVEALYKDIKGFRHHGVIASTENVPFDLTRPELLDCLKIYSQAEQNGGFDYTFLNDACHDAGFMNAREALVNYTKNGISPLTKWQTHLFEYLG